MMDYYTNQTQLDQDPQNNGTETVQLAALAVIVAYSIIYSMIFIASLAGMFLVAMRF